VGKLRARRRRNAPNYDRKLARRITLADGTKLITLRDAANLFATQFATVKSWRLLERAIERLIAAAESAERDTVKIATDSIEHVVMAKPSPSPKVLERDNTVIRRAILTP
jgi:hypothetical protein